MCFTDFFLPSVKQVDMLDVVTVVVAEMRGISQSSTLLRIGTTSSFHS